MNSLVIIGGGRLQVPVIVKAKEMGYSTIVVDMNKDAPGMTIADQPICLSTKDCKEVTKVIEGLNKGDCIKGALTVGTDMSVTVAAITSKLGLPGHTYSAAVNSTVKWRMRKQFDQYNVPSPFHELIIFMKDRNYANAIVTSLPERFEDENNYPIVFKPADNMGARGVSKSNSIKENMKAFKYAAENSLMSHILVEEYVKGPELSIDAMVLNGDVKIMGVADRIIEDGKYFVELGHTMPSQLPQEKIDNAIDVMKQGIKALGLSHGFAKGDIKVTNKGAVIIELAARLSGGYMSTHTFPLSTGVDLMEMAIKVSVGEDPGNTDYTYDRVAIERAIVSDCKGIIKSMGGLAEAVDIPGLEGVFLNVDVGDRVVKPKSNVEKIGNIIATGKTLKEAEEAVKKCRDCLDIVISEDIKQ